MDLNTTYLNYVRCWLFLLVALSRLLRLYQPRREIDAHRHGRLIFNLYVCDNPTAS